mmetsp:Transcript_60542/g.167787  ORF Transcript_60542/g.167787 Transcript_60542/m.167787 type:complete len:200 (-) Transcript_60542:148-747(-)
MRGSVPDNKLPKDANLETLIEKSCSGGTQRRSKWTKRASLEHHGMAVRSGSSCLPNWRWQWHNCAGHNHCRDDLLPQLEVRAGADVAPRVLPSKAADGGKRVQPGCVVAGRETSEWSHESGERGPCHEGRPPALCCIGTVLARHVWTLVKSHGQLEGRDLLHPDRMTIPLCSVALCVLLVLSCHPVQVRLSVEGHTLVN